MSGTVELPSEELRKQYKHLAFQLAAKQVKPAVVEKRIGTSSSRHELDVIAESTNYWQVALDKTRLLTRWLEISRTKSLQEASARGWISVLYMENRLAEMANKLAVNCWLKHAGKATIILMEAGGLRNMVIEIRKDIPMVQTRFKKKTQHYFGASELPLILASTDLGFLICKDAHERTHRSGDIALSVTKQIAFIVGAKKVLLSI